jgi:hypothetical protein
LRDLWCGCVHSGHILLLPAHGGGGWDGTGWHCSLRSGRTADTETARARQAEADAREEAQRVRDDAARERDALRESHAAQLEAQRALTDAERARAERAEAQLETERADRRQLTSHITSNGHEPPAPARSGARSK